MKINHTYNVCVCKYVCVLHVCVLHLLDGFTGLFPVVPGTRDNTTNQEVPQVWPTGMANRELARLLELKDKWIQELLGRKLTSAGWYLMYDFVY